MDYKLSGLTTFFYGGLISMAILVIMVTYFIFNYFFGTDEFTTTHRLEPIIELRIDGDKVDSLFIYREP